jgi:hypothetical protein
MLTNKSHSLIVETLFILKNKEIKKKISKCNLKLL